VTATRETRLDEGSRLSRDVTGLWPTAPPMEAGRSGRWIRFDRPRDGAIYLQRYIWDEPCVPQFLVITCPRRGQPDQRRYDTLSEAVAAIRDALQPLARDGPAPDDAPPGRGVPTVLGGMVGAA